MRLILFELRFTRAWLTSLRKAWRNPNYWLMWRQQHPPGCRIFQVGPFDMTLGIWHD